MRSLSLVAQPDADGAAGPVRAVPHRVAMSDPSPVAASREPANGACHLALC
jgi:hypothetical protein